jgi:uncharacterized protein YdbL (DUF1318 family)
MTMKLSLLRFVTLAFAFVLGIAAVTALAEDLGSVKARMNQRLAQLDQLKSSGAVGENNRGFAEVRGGGGDASSVVSAENADREVVYAAIAKQTGSTADQVGRARAHQIAAGSAKGVWLQKDDGSWYKK